ncbi:ABC transporter, permease domain protein, partial [Vibrio parahaemolyticus V-223/04]|jgi:hypothetical protein
LLA